MMTKYILLALMVNLSLAYIWFKLAYIYLVQRRQGVGTSKVQQRQVNDDEFEQNKLGRTGRTGV